MNDIWIPVEIRITIPAKFILWATDIDEFWRPLLKRLYKRGKLHAKLQIGDWEPEKIDLQKVHPSWWGKYENIGRDLA